MDEYDEFSEAYDEAAAMAKVIPIKLIKELNILQKNFIKKQKKLQKRKSKSFVKCKKTKHFTMSEKHKNLQTSIIFSEKILQSKRVRFINQKNDEETSNESNKQRRRINKMVSIQAESKCASQKSIKVLDNIQQLSIKKISYEHIQNTTFDIQNKLKIGSGQDIGVTEITFEDGSLFRGKYENGVIISGEINFKKKMKYRGDFFLGRFHGRGELTFHSGQKISGEWNQGDIIGKAIIKYPKGQIYYGEIKDFKRHGQGYLFFPDGSKYEGTFKEGELTGYGTHISKNGTMINGFWIQGDYVGTIESVFQSLYQRMDKESLKNSRSRKKKTFNKKQYIENISLTKIVSIKKID